MRPLVLASLLAAFVGFSLPHVATAAPMPAFSQAAPSAAVQDPSLRQVYWYWWHGRRVWRPGPWHPHYYGPPPYHHHHWHRRWWHGGWHYW